MLSCKISAAKLYQVQTGEPVATALRKCPELYLVRPDFKLYEQCSKAFFELCSERAPIAERYSIDECFLDMSGMQSLYPDPIAAAEELKDAIRNSLGFTVSVGVGSNKLLAKMASDLGQADQVESLFIDEIESKLWPLPVRQLFSVGRATASRLHKVNIRTIGQLARAERSLIESLVGVKLGQQIHRYAHGQDESPVLAEAAQAKGYSHSTTLAEDVTEKAHGYRILDDLADRAASRMRADRVRAHCISVTLRSRDFIDRSRQQTLSQATDITAEICSIAHRLFDELWDGVTPLRLLGVSLTDLTCTTHTQLSFFSDVDKEREEKIDRTIDTIRKKFGRSAISRGVTDS